MKRCEYCGTFLQDDNMICSNCGGYCKINNEFNQNNYHSPNDLNKISEDKSNIGYNLLSFLFPIVGLIFYIVWKDQYPIKAKKCGKWALIRVIFTFAFYFFIIFLLPLLLLR